jgi:hypothetical protein
MRLANQVELLWNQLREGHCSKRFTVRYGELLRLRVDIGNDIKPSMFGGQAPTFAWMITDSEQEANEGHGFTVLNMVAGPPLSMAGPDDPAMQLMDPVTLQPLVSSVTLAAHNARMATTATAATATAATTAATTATPAAVTTATPPVPAGTVIQQGPPQGAATAVTPQQVTPQDEAPPPWALPTQAVATDSGPTDMDVTEEGNGNTVADGVDFNP